MIWGYKIEGGEVVARLFEGKTLPKGWADTPAKLKKPADDDRN